MPSAIKWKNLTDNTLHKSYPKEILYSIFKGTPIAFKKKNARGKKTIRRLKNGFIQKVGSIYYKVANGDIYFRDKRRNILIRIKKL